MPDSAIYALALATPVCAAVGYGLWAINQKVSHLQSLQQKAEAPVMAQPELVQVGQHSQEMAGLQKQLEMGQQQLELKSREMEIERAQHQQVLSERQLSLAKRVEEIPEISPLEVGQSLVLGGRNSQELLELSRIATTVAVKSKDTSLTPATQARLGRLVQNVLGEAGRTALTKSGTYVLKFSPEIMNGLRDGTLELISNQNGLRSIVRNAANKRFAANATLESPGLVGSPAAACLLVWQVAAVVTAQKYLADIDKKLSSLESQMDEVLHWLEDQERGVLLGNYHYLSRIRSALSSQECTEIETQVFSSQLEQIDRECLQVQYAAYQRLKRIEFDVVKHNEKKISAEESMEEAKQLANSCSRCVQVILMTLQIRCLTLELKAAMSASHDILQSRLDEMKTEYTSLQNTFKDCMEPLSKVPELNHWFGVADKKIMYEGRVKSLKLQAEKEFAEVMHSKEKQLGYLERTLHAEIQRAQEPLELGLQVGEGGELIAVAPLAIAPSSGLWSGFKGYLKADPPRSSQPNTKRARAVPVNVGQREQTKRQIPETVTSGLGIIEKNRVVTFHYTLKDQDGNLLEKSFGGDPVNYLHGHNSIPGLESHLNEKKVGDKLHVHVTPENGYGSYDPEKRFLVDRAQLPPADLEMGMTLELEADDGEPLLASIVAIDDMTLEVDANHPMAGKDLFFDVEIIAIRQASTEEIFSGEVLSAT